jgi:PKD repeat protein
MSKATFFRRATVSAVLPAFLATFGGSAARLSAAAPQSPLQIDHDPLACVTPRECPKIEAAVAPGQVFQKSYVYFKAAQTEDFYYVLMNGEPQSLAGVLPRPLPETPAIDYYLRAVDREELSKKTPDYLPPVVPTEGVCKARGVPIAAGAAGAGLTIGLTRENQDPVPAGFNRNDVAKVILVSGAVVTVAEALKLRSQTSTSKKSSGTTAALIAGGAVVAGGAVAIIANNRGGSSPGNPSLTVTASATSGQAPLMVTFSAPVQGGKSPFTFAWNFGDGSPASTLQNPTHTYQLPGSYNASVTVTDSRGRTAMANVTINVSGPPPLNFVEADVQWSGPSDIDLNILNSAGAMVGQPFRVVCGPTENRGERVVLQDTSLVSGTYSVTLTGNSCASGNPPTITAQVSVVTDQGPDLFPSCNGLFVVSVGQTLTVCMFTVP